MRYLPFNSLQKNLKSLTKLFPFLELVLVLVGLYEEPEKPDNPIE